MEQRQSSFAVHVGTAWDEWTNDALVHHLKAVTHDLARRSAACLADAKRASDPRATYIPGAHDTALERVTLERERIRALGRELASIVGEVQRRLGR